MKKILVLLYLSAFSVFGAELNWADSYKDAITKAKAENKNVMLLITSHTCRWCRKLESETLTDEGIIKRMNKDYISVHVTRGEDNYPAALVAPGVPATYFLDSEGKPIIKKVMGYWNIEDYISFLDDVDYKLGRKEY
ncbi:MAG: thioredoxin [Arcobacter sp.]|nr:MAG: thioredoxin [Arcobacter sp.]